MNDKTNGNSQSNVGLTGEREAFDKWFRAEQMIADHIETTFISEAFLPYKAFKAGAAWQRTQAAGVPEGWRRAVYHAEECLTGCMASPDIARSLDAETVRKIIADLRATRFAMLAAAPAQPAIAKEATVISEVKHYWPEEIVGTGELVVYLQDYAALEAECERLREALRTAHAFIESTEAFGKAAASGVLECGGVTWNIDESKALLAASTGQEVEK